MDNYDDLLLSPNAANPPPQDQTPGQIMAPPPDRKVLGNYDDLLRTPQEIEAKAANDFMREIVTTTEVNPAIPTLEFERELEHTVRLDDPSSMVRLLERRGIKATSVMYDPEEQARAIAEGTARYKHFESAGGLSALEGKGVDTAKDTLLKASIVSSLAYRADVDPYARVDLAVAAGRKLVQGRIDDQYNKARVLGEASASDEMQQNAAIAGALMQMPKSTWVSAMHQDAAVSIDRPVNSWEAATIANKPQPLDEMADRLAWTFTDIQPFIENPSRIDGPTALRLIGMLYGKSHTEGLLYNQYLVQKDNYFYGLLGAGNKQNNDGTWSQDGTNFTALATKSLTALTTAKQKTVTPGSELYKNLFAVAQTEGKGAAQRRALDMGLEELTNLYAIGGAMTEREGANLAGANPAQVPATLAENAHLPLLSKGFKPIFDVMTKWGTETRAYLTSAEQTLRASNWGNDAVKNPAYRKLMAEDWNTLSMAVASIWNAPTSYDPKTGKHQLISMMAAEDPRIAALPPDVQKELRRQTETWGALARTTLPRLYRLNEEATNRMAQYQAGIAGKDYGIEQKISDTAALTFGGLIIPIVDSLTTALDDPKSIPGMLTSFYAQGAAGSWLAKASGVGKVMHSMRLRTDLRNMATYFPEKIVTFKRAAQERLATIAEMGGGAAAETRLQELVGVLSKANEHFVRTGTVGKAAPEAVDAIIHTWGDLAPNLGELGKIMGSSQLSRSMAGMVRDTLRNMFGKDPVRPNKILASALADLETRGVVPGVADTVRALQDMVGTKEMTNEFEQRVETFFAKEGRVPNKIEMAAMEPEAPFATLHGMAMAAERHPEVVTGPFQKLWGQIFNGFKATPEGIRSMVAGVNTMLDDMILEVHGNVLLRTRRNQIIRRHELISDAVIGKFEAQLDQWDVAGRMMHDTFQTDPTLSNANRAGLVEAIAANDARIMEVKGKIKAWKNHKERAQKGNVTDDVAFPPELNAQAEVSPDMMYDLRRLYPAQFEMRLPETLFTVERAAPPKEMLQGAEQSLSKLWEEGRVLATEKAKMQKSPHLHDDTWKAMGLEIKKYQDLLEKVPEKTTDDVYSMDGAVVPDHQRQRLEYQGAIERLRGERAARFEALKRGDVHPTAKAELEGRIQASREQVRDQARTLDRLRSGKIQRRIVDEGEVSRFWVDTQYRGFKDGALNYAKKAMDIINAQHQKIGLNPFSLSSLPLWLKGDHLRDSVVGAANWSSARFAMTDELAQALNMMDQPTREFLSQLQKKGVPLASAHVAQHPVLAKFIEKKGVRLDQIDDYMLHEQAAFREYWDELKRTGKVPPHILKTWEKIDYNPPVYGLLERPGLIADEKVRGQIASATGESKMQTRVSLVTAMEKEQLMYQRAWDKWRVRVVEPDMVVERLFDNEADAARFVKNEYGRDIRELTRDGAVRKGATIWGDDLSVGDPITAAERKVLDPVLGETAVQRLRRLRMGYRDIAIQNLLESFNIYGSVALDAAQHKALLKQNLQAAAMYEKVPENQQMFGTMAGKYVHRGALSEIARSTHTFDVLGNALDGIKEAWTETYGRGPGEVAGIWNKLLKGFDAMNNIARRNLILGGFRSFANNVMFYPLSDHLAGSKVWTAQGAPMLIESARALAHKGVAIDADLVAARRTGLISGSHGRPEYHYRRLLASGLQADAAKLGELSAKILERETLLDEWDLAHPNDRNYQLERDVHSLKAIERDATQGFIKKTFKQIVSIGLTQRHTVQGLPIAPVENVLRSFYSALDDWHKLAQFKSMTRRGLSPEVATKQIKLFAQVYGEVPHYVRDIPSPVRSLITAFPFELGRITANGFIYQPARMVGFLGILPALNLFGATTAGVDMQRMRAIMEARGAKDGIRATSMLLSQLMFFNPKTGNLDFSIDYGGALPFGPAVMGRGFLVSAYDKMVPREQRGWLTHLGSLGVGVASNFVGNNPAMNAIGYFTMNNNPLTGEPLVDETMSPMKKTWSYLKQIAKDTLPPIMPFGRDWERIQDSLETSINPRTGRRYIGDGLATTLISSLTGITVRGTLADQLSAALGSTPVVRTPLATDKDIALSVMYEVAALPGVGGKPAMGIPLFSDFKELRNLMYRAADESLAPDKKQAAIDAMMGKLKEQKVRDYMGLELVFGKTDRQALHEMLKIQQMGYDVTFGALPVHAQALALWKMDRAGVGENVLRDLVVSGVLTSRMKVKPQQDPELVSEAIKYIRNATEISAPSPALVKFRNYLETYAAPMAAANFEREKSKLPIQAIWLKQIDEMKRGIK